MKGRRFDSSDVIAAVVVATVLGIPMLILQRYVAETRGAAIALVGIWLALVGVAVLIIARRRPRLRLALAGTWVAVLLGTLAIGYWTGFRDMRVMEDVAMASGQASAAQRDSGLSGGSGGGSPSGSSTKEPVELATGAFEGADGHAGSGTATVIEQPGGERVLTFTEFDVDPGVDVEVYLTPGTDSIDDRIELGGLKGNVGDQQYEIPADADLRRYDSVILWCTPFTVRIAVAALGA
jgi:hypothetical protein